MNQEEFLRIIKKNYIPILLLIIFLLSFHVRSIPGYKLEYPRLQAIDPYFFFRMGEYHIENGELPSHDILAQWGSVESDRRFEYALATYSYLSFYYVLNPVFGVSWYWIAVWIPALFGALQVLFMYLLGKAMFNRKVGLLAAAFLAFTPGILYRVSSGFIEKEPVAGILMVLGFLFFVKAFKEKKIKREFPLWKFIRHPSYILHRTSIEDRRLMDAKTVIYAFLSGLFFSLMAGTSGLVNIPIIILSVFVVVVLLLNRYSRTFFISYVVMFLSFLVLTRTPYTFFPHMSIGMITNYVALLLIFIRFGAERFGVVKKEHMIFLIPSVVIVFGVCFLISSYIFIDIGMWLNGVIRAISNPISADVIGSTVAESQTTGGFIANTLSSYGTQNAIGTFGLPGFFIYFSAIYFSFISVIVMVYEFFFRKMRIEYLLLLCFFILGMQAAIGAVRLMFIFSFPVAITAAYTLVRGGEFVVRRSKRLKQEHHNYIKIFVTGIIALIIFSNFLSGWVMANGIGSSLDDSWYDSLIWLRDNTNEDAVVLEWWDYGWWFHYVAKKRTLVDGGFHAAVPTRDIAKFYTEPISNRSLNFLKHYNVTHVMVSPDLIPKFGAMSKIANWGRKVDVLPVFQLTNQYQEGGKTLLEYSIGGEKILVGFSTIEEGNTTKLGNVTAVIKSGQGQAYIRDIGMGDQVIRTEKENTMPGMVYMAGDAVIFLPEAVQDCMFVRLYLFDGKGFESLFEKVYDNKGMKIYEVSYENFPEGITGDFINIHDLENAI